MTAIYNTVLVVMIVSTMLASGLSSRVGSLAGIFHKPLLVGLVVLVNLVVVPLIGWLMAEVFSLDTPNYVALIMIACSPGAPFAAKLIMMQKGDLETGAALQVTLALIGSVTFALTANLVFSAAGVADISLPVGDLIKTVVVLQLIPFGVGLAMHEWATDTADEWRPVSLRVSSISFPLVLVLCLLGSWQQIIDLLGSDVLIAAALFTVLSIAAGYVLSPGPQMQKTTMATIAPMRNAAPVMAATAIAFDNDPTVLAAVSGILLVSLTVALVASSYLSKQRSGEEVPVSEAKPAPPAATPAVALSTFQSLPRRPDLDRAA